MRRLITAIVMSVLVLSCTETKKAVSSGNNANDGKISQVQAGSFAKIPGLMPVDVYQNMEAKGFKTKKTFSNDGNLWTSEYDDSAISYRVQTYSHDVTSVESVQATARITDVVNKDIAATEPFFVFLSSLPYDGSNPQKVAQWIQQNFDKDNSSVTVSNVTFTLNAPSKFARILFIAKAP